MQKSKFSFYRKMTEQMAEKIVFAKEVTCQLRKLEAPSEQGLNENLLFRVISTPSACVLKLSSEQDIYFNFSAVIDRASYEEMRREQNLMVTYADFPSHLAKLLTTVQREQKQYIAIFFVGADGLTGKVDIIENFKGFKYIDIISLPVESATQAEIQEDIARRYALLREQNIRLQAQVNELRSVIKNRIPNFAPGSSTNSL